ncbi:MAG TPA: two-component regulator propeller domain-containing protein, partial [Candidatus Acidoferrales bacterium]|nr:two-component regulator propeller domain-containing protein [Candidatus Acidoferrales bacterium]
MTTTKGHPSRPESPSPFFPADRRTALVGRLCHPVEWLLFVLLATLVAPGVAPADSRLGDFAVTRWTRENGLPDNSVTCVLQTYDGFLWIGTAKGLARFDGVKFVPLRLSNANNSVEKGITALYQDAGGRLWIGTREDGLWCLAGGSLSQLDPEQGFARRSVTCIAGGRGGDVWVGTTNGLCRFNGTNLACFTTAQGLPSDVISSVHVSGPDTVWITTRQGMCQFKDGRLSPLEFHTDSTGASPEMIGIYNDQRGNLWAFGDTYLVNLNDGKRFNYFRSGDTLSLRIWSSCEGRDGQLWLGTSGQGVFSFAEGHFRPLLLRDANLGSDVQAIHEDGEGNLWLGTFSSGLLQLQVRRVQTLDAGIGLPVEMARCLAVADDGAVWAGYAKDGLFVKAGERFERVKMPDGLEPFNLIASLAATPQGELWAGTLGLGLERLKEGAAERLTTENGLSDDEILAVAAQRDGSVWAGTESGMVHHLSANGIQTFGSAAGLEQAPITSILVTAAGSVFVGTAAGAVAQLHDGRFVPLDSSALLAGTPIHALCEDPSGCLWIGTQGKGLAWKTGGQVTLWDAKRGFPDDDVSGILTDDAGRVWVSTRRGIHVLTPAATNSAPGALPNLQTVSQYARSSLAAAKWGWPQAAKGRDGRMWFAGPSEIYVLDPRDFHPAPAPLRVELENVSVNGQPWPFRNPSGSANRFEPGQPLQFPSHLRTLEIEFTAPCLVAPEQLRFQHRLDHFDKDWVDNDADRRVGYNGLPFGQYQFHVRAKNLDGTWGPDNASLAFFLPPPFWRQPSVIAAEALVVVSAVAAVVRLFSHRRLRLKLAQLGQREAMERERMRIARDMHDEIGSRLTRISYFSELALQEEVPSRDSLHSIAHTIRDLLQTLDEIVWAVNPQNDTLENLAAYLGYFVTEYLHNTAVQCRLNIPPNLPVIPLTAETRHNVFLA